MLIRQADRKNVIFVTISIFLDKRFKFQLDVCNVCHDVLMMSINFSDIADIHSGDYRCIIGGIRKIEAINLM